MNKLQIFNDETTIPESYIDELSEAEQRVIMAYRQASEERRQIADNILLPKQWEKGAQGNGNPATSD